MAKLHFWIPLLVYASPPKNFYHRLGFLLFRFGEQQQTFFLRLATEELLT